MPNPRHLELVVGVVLRLRRVVSGTRHVDQHPVNEVQSGFLRLQLRPLAAAVLRQLPAGDMFETYMTSFEHVWSNATPER